MRELLGAEAGVGAGAGAENFISRSIQVLEIGVKGVKNVF